MFNDGELGMSCISNRHFTTEITRSGKMAKQYKFSMNYFRIHNWMHINELREIKSLHCHLDFVSTSNTDYQLTPLSFKSLGSQP